MISDIKDVLSNQGDHWKIELIGLEKLEEKDRSLYLSIFEQKAKDFWKNRNFITIKIDPDPNFHIEGEKIISDDPGVSTYMIDMEYPIVIKDQKVIIKLKNEKDYKVGSKTWKIFSSLIELLVEKTNREINKQYEN